MGTVIIGFFKNLLTGLITSLFSHTLATLACAYSVIGGLAATGTWVGDMISGFVGLFWWWTPYVLFFGGLIMFLGDLGRDGIPEAFAIFLPLFLPSFATAVPENGKLHDLLNGWIDDTNNYLDGTLGEWIGGPGQEAVLTVVTVTAIAFAVIAQVRYLKKRTGTTTTSPTALAGPTAPGVRSRRARP